MQSLLAFIAIVIALCACGDSDSRQDLFTETRRDYPDGGSTVDLERVGQPVIAPDFYGWRMSPPAERGQACPAIVDPSGSLVCAAAATKQQKVFVDLDSFPQAMRGEFTIQQTLFRELWNIYFGPGTGLGWSWAAGTASDHTLKIVAGSVSGSGFASDDIRRYMQFGCSGATTLVEVPAMAGVSWTKCSKAIVTVDPVKLIGDCSSCQIARIRQAVGVAYGIGAGIGISNAEQGRIQQRQRVQTQWLGGVPGDTPACAMGRYNLTLGGVIIRDTDVCDSWDWEP